MDFLSIKIDEITKEQALQKVSEFLSSSNQYKIFTPNPEFVVKAQKDEYFKKVLNSGDLNLCDGMGLRIFTGIKRIPGVDFMLEVCKLAEEQGKGIYLLGSGNDEVVRQACEQLNKNFPNLKISGYNKGPELDENSVGKFDNYIFEEINKTGAEVLFVAFGMGKQEKWIYENLSKMPSVKIAMGVGGSFEFISGKIKRAPLFMRQLGLEWVYRLAQQPQRIGRIFNATIKFTWLAIFKNI
ncbi:MAG TPA: WecB/TagA/CpsF family glycosyltransferase [Candidatus Udaeobacter sp.]|nr:WecB/TagA/CpsF family glycosyltransferase [Candidatus Udaeobacter sp.]